VIVTLVFRCHAATRPRGVAAACKIGKANNHELTLYSTRDLAYMSLFSHSCIGLECKKMSVRYLHRQTEIH